MFTRIALALLRYTPWLVAAGAAAYTVWALNAQIVTQHQLNAAMQGVKVNVARARELTGETAAALRPLATTADTLENMNKGLELTVIDLQAMNGSMARVKLRQQAIVTRLDSLNGRMGLVVADLGAVESKNQALLTVTHDMTGTTSGQAATLGSLSDLTESITGYLGRINGRLSFLQRF